MIPGLDILADCVRHHLDLDAPVTLERIATGKFNTSWFVHIGDDRECVLRIAPPDDNVFLFYERQMMRQEPRIHQLLLENTDVPVAPVIATRIYLPPYQICYQDKLPLIVNAT